MEKIGILGAGGMAREAARYSVCDVDFFAVQEEYIHAATHSLSGIELINIEEPNERQVSTAVIAALGAPAIRRSIVKLWKGEKFATITAESAEVFTQQSSEGLIIAPRAVITEGVSIGNHTIINVGSTISHDCELGDYVTVGPGAHIGGNVKLADGVFVGIGAVIKNGVSVADGSVIGAGAVVLKDVEVPNSVVVGNPAKVIKIQEGWLSHV